MNFATLPFAEQIEFFRQKKILPTHHWDDIIGEAHDHAFVVAGAIRTSLLEDLRQAVDDAMSSGRTLEQFRRDFEQIAQRHGWAYRGHPGWRAQMIYETNLRQSYNAGREAQMADPEFRRLMPYRMYRHSGARHYRPLHKSWNGLVLPHDDPWWDSHSPQNGFGCKCTTVAVGPVQLQQIGKTGPDAAPNDGFYDHINPRTGEITRLPNGVDYGFQYRPGAAWLKANTPPPLGISALPHGPIPATQDFTPLPPPRVFPAGQLLSAGLTDEQYVNAFLSEFGGAIGSPVVFRDLAGEPLAINEELFRQRRNNSWKVQKRGRERYLRLLAASIKAPDEIWVSLEWHHVWKRFALRRRYISRWLVDGADTGLAVFEHGRDGWSGITTFAPDEATVEDIDRYVQGLRQGVLVYRRK